MPDYPICRARKRHGRCYELAGKALLRLPKGTEWRLIHSELIGGHAWLERDGEVWDPVRGRQSVTDAMGADAYRSARGRIQYTRRQAAENVANTKTWGPWV